MKIQSAFRKSFNSLHAPLPYSLQLIVIQIRQIWTQQTRSEKGNAEEEGGGREFSFTQEPNLTGLQEVGECRTS